MGNHLGRIFDSVSFTRNPVFYEQIPIFALLVILELFLDDANHDFVRNQSTGIHNFLGFHTEFGLLRNLFSEDVAGSQVTNAVFLFDPRCLCTLSCFYSALVPQKLYQNTHLLQEDQ